MKLTELTLTELLLIESHLRERLRHNNGLKQEYINTFNEIQNRLANIDFKK